MKKKNCMELNELKQIIKTNKKKMKLQIQTNVKEQNDLKRHHEVAQLSNDKEQADLKRKFEVAQLETNGLNILAAQLKSELKSALEDIVKLENKIAKQSEEGFGAEDSCIVSTNDATDFLGMVQLAASKSFL